MLERLDIEHRQLVAVLQQLPVGVLVAEAPSGKIVLSNAQVQALAGHLMLPSGGIETYGELPAFHPDGRPLRSEEWPLARAIRHGETVTDEEVQYARGDGTRGWILVNAAPIRNREGRIVAGVAVFHDIGERKEAEAARQAMERERDAFLTSVAHDLKSPLAAVKGNVQLLQRQLARAGTFGSTPEIVARQVERLGRIDATVNRMASLVDELLDLTRLQMGRPLDLDRQPTDLVALARRLAAEHQQVAELHRLRVEATVPELAGMWDPARLARVLDNLLSNAIKFSPEGGDVTVTVGRETRESEHWAVLAVRDQGLGIPEADLPHVFERFHRAGNVVRIVRGTGIGLASARQIVEQHGGTIAVTSQEGHGATVTVRLPLSASTPTA